MSTRTTCWWIDVYRWDAPSNMEMPLDDWESFGVGGGGGAPAGGETVPENVQFPDTAIAQVVLFKPDTANLPITPPDCSPSAQLNNRVVRAWCTGSPVSPERMTILRSAVARIAARADTNCARLAERLASALDSAGTEVRTFDPNYKDGDQQPFKDFPAGSAVNGSWFAISQDYVDNLHSKKKRVIDISTGKYIELNLEDVLVHEADHLDGWSNRQQHTTSPNMAACGSRGAF